MVKVICEKTGLEFEAKTSRTKNHPQIMNIVNEASKDGWYRECLAALEEYKCKFESVEEYVEILDTVRESHENKVSALWKAKVQEKFAAREAAREKAIRDAKLARHGYTWQRVSYPIDDEDYAYYTVLVAPDGAEVSVSQALAEIENPALVQERLAKQAQTVQEPSEPVLSEKEQMRNEAQEKVIEEQAKRGGTRKTADNEPDLDLFESIFAGWTKEELNR